MSTVDDDLDALPNLEIEQATPRRVYWCVFEAMGTCTPRCTGRPSPHPSTLPVPLSRPSSIFTFQQRMRMHLEQIEMRCQFRATSQMPPHGRRRTGSPADDHMCSSAISPAASAKVAGAGTSAVRCKAGIRSSTAAIAMPATVHHTVDQGRRPVR